MQRYIQFSILLLLITVRSGAAVENPFLHRLEDQTVLERGGRHVYAADVDGSPDRSDELVVHDRTCAICRKYDPDTSVWRVVWQFNYPGLGDLRAPTDVTGDGRADFLLSTTLADSSRWLTCFDPALDSRGQPSLRYELGPFLQGCRPGAERIVGRVYVRGVLDLAGTGRLQALIFSYPYRAGILPRSLIAFDGSSGRESWRLDVAPVVGEMAVWSSPNGSGQRLIVLTGHAPGNGFAIDGTSDDRSYVYCLDAAGRLLWRTPMGGEGSCVSGAIIDLDHDGADEILVGCTGKRVDDPAAPRTPYAYLDPETGRPTGIELAVPEPRIMRAFPGTRDAAVLILSSDQHLYCVDGSAVVRWRTAARVDLLDGLADLDGDGRDEIVAHCGPQLVVLNGDGKPVARRTFPTGETAVEFALMRLNGKPCVLAQGAAYAYVVRLVEPASAATVALMALAGTAVLAVPLARRHRRRAGQRVLDRRDNQERLLMAMVAFGHVGASLRVMDRLRFRLKNWNVDALLDSEEAEIWRDLVMTFERTVCPDLVGLAALARRASVPPERWTGILSRAQVSLRGLKALSSPALAAQEASGDNGASAAWRGTSEADERVKLARQVLDELDEDLKGVRSHLRQVFQAPVVSLIRGVLARQRDDIHAAGVTVRTEIRCEEGHLVFVSPGDLDKILDGMVDNALRHMRGRARRELVIAVEGDSTVCRIEVRDTGCGLGLPRAEWERVFDRQYTTRPSVAGQPNGGFGLYYARESLAKYSGRVFVAASDPQQGTVFRIVVRNVEE